MDTKSKIQVVINTLNQVQVSGKKNLDFLLGSIQTLEQVKNELGANTDEKSNQD